MPERTHRRPSEIRQLVILDLAGHGPTTTGAIRDRIGTSWSVANGHLQALAEATLAESVKASRGLQWSLTPMGQGYAQGLALRSPAPSTPRSRGDAANGLGPDAEDQLADILIELEEIKAALQNMQEESDGRYEATHKRLVDLHGFAEGTSQTLALVLEKLTPFAALAEPVTHVSASWSQTRERVVQALAELRGGRRE